MKNRNIHIIYCSLLVLSIGVHFFDLSSDPHSAAELASDREDGEKVMPALLGTNASPVNAEPRVMPDSERSVVDEASGEGRRKRPPEQEQDTPRVDAAAILTSIGSRLESLAFLKTIDSELSDDDIGDIRDRFLSLGRNVLDIAQSKVTVDPLRQDEEEGVSAFRLPRFEEGMELYSAFASGIESRYGSNIWDVLNDRFVNHVAFGQYGKKEVLAQFQEDDLGRMNWKVIFLGPTGDVETEYAGQVKNAWVKRVGPLFIYEEE
ncbi:MAG: hypothetical protein ACI9R3_002543 [Verrucomicrobiales bacterium]|jgi:hypothetical protein